MNPFMVVATFKPDTKMDEVMAVVPQEQQRIAELQAEGRIESLYLATAARQTVFLVVAGSSSEDVSAIVQTLPMALWWDLDIYPLNPPAQIATAS